MQRKVGSRRDPDPEVRVQPHIGVFVCDCKGLISDRVDVDRVVKAAEQLENVDVVQRADVLCSRKGIAAMKERIRDGGCDRVLFVGCSARSSLKFPEDRLTALLQDCDLPPAMFEVANVREQCAWQHSDRNAATAKAVDLMRMAHARLASDEAAPAPSPIAKRALVVGGGAAGLQAAKDLASAGIPVTLVERSAYLGGHVCRINRIFQSEGWPSVCESKCVGPVQARDVVMGSRTDIRTQARILGAERRDGSFHVRIRSAPRFVDDDLCIGCNKCTEVCPESLPRNFDGCLTSRKAIDKDFERALPDTYNVVDEACTRCGECVPVCPTDAIDLEAQPTEEEIAFGAVFLATGFEDDGVVKLPEYGGGHPDVVTSSTFEHLLERGLACPSDGREPESVVFVQCAGSRAGPDKQGGGVSYCSKTCCAVTAKHVDRLSTAYPMTEAQVVYYRDIRTTERAAESLNQKLRAMGMEYVEGEVTSIEPGEESGLRLTVEPTEELCECSEPKHLDADLVVLATPQQPGRGARELAEMFGVRLDRDGFPIENQPRLFRPTESFVDRVYAVGASSGPKVVQQAVEQGSAAAMRALATLTRGEVDAPRFASRIHGDRCVSCRICEAVCPHGAIRITEAGAVSDPAFCQACGFCAAACPVHAAELTNFTDQQILEQARVAFSELPESEPRILALLCYWCAYSAADFAGIERVEVPASYRAIRIRCASSVNTALLLKMFQLGVDGILVAGCPERSCHHLWGNFVADKRVTLAKSLLDQLGYDPRRLRFEYIGAPQQDKLVEILRNMDQGLRALGRNPATSAPEPEPTTNTASA